MTGEDLTGMVNLIDKNKESRDKNTLQETTPISFDVSYWLNRSTDSRPC